jgi:hypothetical protein
LCLSQRIWPGPGPGQEARCVRRSVYRSALGGRGYTAVCWRGSRLLRVGRHAVRCARGRVAPSTAANPPPWDGRPGWHGSHGSHHDHRPGRDVKAGHAAVARLEANPPGIGLRHLHSTIGYRRTAIPHDGLHFCCRDEPWSPPPASLSRTTHLL